MKTNILQYFHFCISALYLDVHKKLEKAFDILLHLDVFCHSVILSYFVMPQNFFFGYLFLLLKIKQLSKAATRGVL